MRIGKKVFGHGINDVKDRVSINGKAIKVYQCWKNMLQRCYGDKYIELDDNYFDIAVKRIDDNFLI